MTGTFWCARSPSPRSQLGFPRVQVKYILFLVFAVVEHKYGFFVMIKKKCFCVYLSYFSRRRWLMATRQVVVDLRECKEMNHEW